MIKTIFSMNTNFDIATLLVSPIELDFSNRLYSIINPFIEENNTAGSSFSIILWFMLNIY